MTHTAATLASLAAEFPDYPAAGLPALPEGWESTFWRNEPVPTFRTACGLTLLCAFANPARREIPDGPRFVLTAGDPESGAAVVTLAESDSLLVLLRDAEGAARSLSLKGYDPDTDSEPESFRAWQTVADTLESGVASLEFQRRPVAVESPVTIRRCNGNRAAWARLSLSGVVVDTDLNLGALVARAMAAHPAGPILILP